MLSWLKANCPGGGGDVSHLCLSGGSFSLPKGLAGAFLIKYARATQAGEKLFLVERRTPVFRLFVDLDWATPEPMTKQTQLDVARFVAQQAFLIYAPSNRDQQVIVATRRPELRQTDGLLKGGMHLHWPDILTDAETARLFRETAVSRCRERFGEKLMPRPWEDVIDDHVFRGSGLRMLYSCKKAPSDAYSPEWLLRLKVHDELGMVRPEVVGEVPCVEAHGHWVQQCSIRYHGVGKTPVQACVEDRMACNQAQASSPLRDASVEKHARPLEELRSVLPSCYSACRFLKLLEGDCGKFIIRTDSKTCLNLQPIGADTPGSHKSNGVYFVVDQRETYQACFCNCETEEGRLHGPCKTFRSQVWRTPTSLSNSLFPPANTEPFANLTSQRATAEDMYDRFFKAGGPPSKKARQKGPRKVHDK